MIGDLRRDRGALLLVAVLALFLYESRAVGPQYDDAYISYRYAANLVAGHGLVFNPGERVEGISNLLWTLGVALGLSLGMGAREAGHALGVAGGALALIATFAYGRAGVRREQSAWAGVAAWLVLASPAFARWSTSGMETPLFVAAVTGALAAEAWGLRGLATALVCVATGVRPEGALLAASLFGFRLVTGGLRDARAWSSLVVYTLLWIALTAFRLAYYGVPLPNTFYAKAGGVWLGVGAFFALVFALGNGGPCALLAAAALARDRRAWPGAVFAGAMLVYGAWIGASPRYLLPVVPCLAALGAWGAAAWWSRRGAFAALAVAGLAFAALLGFFGLTPPRGEGLAGFLAHPARTAGVASEREDDRRGELLAQSRVQLLRERAQPVRLVATGAIGAFGFESQLPILDILGLTDPLIARSGPPAAGAGFSLPGHQRSNAEYVLAREPDYILIGRGGGALPDSLVPAGAAIRAHPDLARHYAWDAEIIGFRRVR
ncbi:MAG TPA: hypothetical protein VMS55_03140 [Myxococcota bacterium]|nr:hypothetical protein [Myxococcota bacterium]